MRPSDGFEGCRQGGSSRIKTWTSSLRKILRANVPLVGMQLTNLDIATTPAGQFRMRGSVKGL